MRAGTLFDGVDECTCYEFFMEGSAYNTGRFSGENSIHLLSLKRVLF